MISILIVDDINIIRVGTKRLLDDVDGFKVIATAESGEEAIRLVNRYHPDVILMDISMPGMGGIEATKRIKRAHPNLPIIILSVLNNSPTRNHLLNAGASGYLHKDCPVEEIVAAIRMVHEGKQYLCSDSSPAFSESTPLDELSEREFQVLQMLVNGQTIKDISGSLSLSPKTISTYRARLLQKLQVSNDAEMARLAMQYEIL